MFNIPSDPSSAAQLELEAWNLIRTYATTEMSLPDIEKQLEDLYRDTAFVYDDSIFRPTLSKIVSVEDPDNEELVPILCSIDRDIEALSFQAYTVTSPPSISTPPFSLPSPPRPLADVFSLVDFGLDPAELEFSNSGIAAAPPPTPLPQLARNDDALVLVPKKTKLSLSEYSARRKHRVLKGPSTVVGNELNMANDNAPSMCYLFFSIHDLSQSSLQLLSHPISQLQWIGIPPARLIHPVCFLYSNNCYLFLTV